MDDAPEYDHLLKLLLVGDSGVGKSCLLLRFIDDAFEEVAPTIGVDFKLKHIVLNKKRLKLTVWDTAGQERFRTLTSSYYRGAQGIIFVYDITRRETFDNLSEVWMREVEMYCTVPDCVKLVVGNKVDRESERAVSRAEGVGFARAHGCLFLEVSAKSRQGVQEAFAELVQRVVESPSLLAAGAGGAPGGRVQVGAAGPGGVVSSCSSC